MDEDEQVPNKKTVLGHSEDEQQGPKLSHTYPSKQVFYEFLISWPEYSDNQLTDGSVYSFNKF